jgi:hypothetical protein
MLNTTWYQNFASKSCRHNTISKISGTYQMSRVELVSSDYSFLFSLSLEIATPVANLSTAEAALNTILNVALQTFPAKTILLIPRLPLALVELLLHSDTEINQLAFYCLVKLCRQLHFAQTRTSADEAFSVNTAARIHRSSSDLPSPIQLADIEQVN